MNKWIVAAVIVSVIFWEGCAKKNSVSPIPAIAFVSFSPDSVRGGFFEDTAKLVFRFTDGDADLGNDANSGNYDIFLTDSRSGIVTSYSFPYIQDEIRTPEYGMEGTCLINIQAATLIPRNDSVHMRDGDTLTYDVYIKDQAQHESNHFTTTRLIIKP